MINGLKRHLHMNMTDKVMILNLEGDDEGFVEPPKGRAGNYTIDFF
jgi:hypothetical protein